MDNAIQSISVEKQNKPRYQLDSYLSGGKCYSPFEPEPVVFTEFNNASSLSCPLSNVERGTKYLGVVGGEMQLILFTRDLRAILQRGKYKIQYENRMERDAKCVITIQSLFRKSTIRITLVTQTDYNS